ncbi:DEAD/DEAH box helicase [Sporomusa acidovorans]|uniref:RNA polymerase-associated protein RapA n=1 Tax=Sporomusa acidovorans (strain ATCC 49682 / DSM 3132 / Mol) TaxID=1123286 RepID=A0ABZ3J7L9_SPOA4|nr:DEAD/DEAH box helicase [Sporomusa acidovorans]OZC19377.1 RNA polymerase-associated protein RapA [Sporomusa acidovorans DSM 3132]SDD78813.1 Superfamily II DNA or RNA helicase, SNF2 family [Sporomusa acidovorans]
MLILHAAWIKEKNDGAIPRLFLWAEDTAILAAFQEKKLSTDTGKTRFHPFAAPVNELRNLFNHYTDDQGTHVIYRSLATVSILFLPSGITGPFPSPQCLAACVQKTEPTEAAFHPWKLSGLSFPPSEAAALLPLLAKIGTAPPPKALPGADFTYLVILLTLTRRLILEQQYVPMLAKHTYRTTTWYQACWQPYLEEAAGTLDRIVQAMPESFCHIKEYTPSANLHYFRPDKKQTVTSFFNAMVNSCVKEALAIYDHHDLKNAYAALSAPMNNWLQLLTLNNNLSLQLPPKQAEQFHQSLLRWQQNLWPASEQNKLFRTCLRLEEPSNSGWRLNFFLQPADDLSLLVPAEAVWADQQNPGLQQILLCDLAAAAKIFAPITAVLHEPCPTGVDLTTENAYAFLSESTGFLKQSGFGIIVPNWWHKETTPIKLTVEAEDFPANSFLGLNALAAYKLEATIGDQQVSLAELENIVAYKLPLVQMAGRWLEISPAQAAAALAMLRNRQNNNRLISLSSLLHCSLNDGDFDPDEQTEPDTSPLITVKATGHLQTLLQRLSGQQTLPELAAPTAFQGTLRPYQLRGMSWLCFLRGLGLGACLADDMGLGKTIQIIAYLLHNKQTGSKQAPTLIICPTSVIGNWRREIAKFAPNLTLIVHHGSNRLSGGQFLQAAQTADVVISTYTLALRDEELFTSFTWDNVILDEAQNIKNPSTKQTLSINQLKATSRIALTGTPVENRLSELWSILHFINPGYLGTLIQFKQRYATPIERTGDQERQHSLQRLIKPFLLRRLKTDKTIIHDLPEKQETKIYCPLTKEQATLYAAVLEVMLPQIEAATIFTRKALIAATLTKLKQVCNHPAHFLKDGSLLDNRSGKLTRLIEMLEELCEENRRALIFTQYTQMGELLRQYLEQIFPVTVPFLHGGLKQSERDQLVTAFCDEQAAQPFFILSLKAGGVGLNLTRADTVFHFDRWWNPAVENQATDRAFRIGQTKNVQVYKFICPGTLEERIDAMIESKKSLAETIIGTGESWLNQLSTSELKDILTLREAELEGE